MIVRCGQCRAELEVAGSGEFLCPACGTRNVVRAPAQQDPFGVPDLGSQPPRAAADAPNVTWVTCPSCSYRFAVGDVESVGCPTCGQAVTLPRKQDA